MYKVLNFKFIKLFLNKYKVYLLNMIYCNNYFLFSKIDEQMLLSNLFIEFFHCLQLVKFTITFVNMFIFLVLFSSLKTFILNVLKNY